MTSPDNDTGTATHTMVERLAKATVTSNETLARLAEEIRADADARERKVALLEIGQRQNRKLLSIGAIILGLLFIIAAINATNIGRASRQASVTADIARDSQNTYQLLLGCLDVNAPCGKQNADLTRTILGDLKTFNLTVIYCARSNPSAEDRSGDKFFACVEKYYPDAPNLPTPSR